jgi:NAD dependent epimerase/dehydratase family enzyme
VVFNLAGRSVNRRYTKSNRREILQSRVRSTRVVGEAIAGATLPPRAWLQASTATIDAHRYDAANDEQTGVSAVRNFTHLVRSGSASSWLRPASTPLITKRSTGLGRSRYGPQ